MTHCLKCGNKLTGKQTKFCCEKCCKSYNQSLFRKRNRAKINKYFKTWRDKNKDKIKKYKKTYRNKKKLK